MKSFKQFIKEDTDKDIKILSDFTKDDIGKMFMVYDRSNLKMLNLDEREAKHINSLRQLTYQQIEDKSFARLIPGAVIELVDFGSNGSMFKALFKPKDIPKNEYNGKIYGGDGDTLIPFNFNGQLLIIDVFNKNLYKDSLYFIPLEKHKETSGSLIGHYFWGSLDGQDERMVKFDKNTKDKSFVGNIVFGNGKLTSLEGSPKELKGYMYVYENKLRNLIGAPRKISFAANFISPTEKISFAAGDNDLVSLEGIPEDVEGIMSFADCKQLKSLEKIGTYVKRCEKFNFSGCPIESNVLGLLKIHNLKNVIFVREDERDYSKNKVLLQVEKIINKYLPNGNIFDCQSELIDAGLGEFAKP